MSDETITALAIPKDASVQALVDAIDESELAGYEYILVGSRSQYEELAARGLQPILLSLRFSETDTRGQLRLRLGPLLRPWRWRRALLNDGIERVRILRGKDAWAVAIGASLAGSGWKFRR